MSWRLPWLLSALALPLALALAACSHVRVERVTPERPYRDGVRFYRPWPYLLVTEDRHGAVTAEVVYLPDRSEEYVMAPRVRLGSVELEASLEDGWNLTEIGADADPEVADTLAAMARMVTAGGGVGVAPGTGGDGGFPLAPGLYRLLYRGAHVGGVERVELR